MSCPNGHKGGVFCCEDHVNQIMAEFYEKYPHPEQHGPLVPVTLDVWLAYQRKLKEQGDG